MCVTQDRIPRFFWCVFEQDLEFRSMGIKPILKLKCFVFVFYLLIYSVTKWVCWCKRI